MAQLTRAGRSPPGDRTRCTAPVGGRHFVCKMLVPGRRRPGHDVLCTCGSHGAPVARLPHEREH
eukprot:9345352-Pyramimonas_sp.AAC.1